MGPSKDDFSYAIPAANRDAAPRRPRSEISATALERSAITHLRPPPGAKLGNLADLPFDNFEPPPELLKSSGHHLGRKILKLLKLRKKSTSAAPSSTHVLTEDFYQPSLRMFHFQDLISNSTQFPAPIVHVDDVTKRYNYDSDEHSGNYASDSQNFCSASIISSSSRNSNSSAQSFDSHRSSGTPRSPLCSGQLSSSQLMANILISIMDEEDSASGSASEEHGSSEDEVHIVTSLNGPHESAWHQPRDEMFHADSPTARGRQSSSTKQSSGRHTLRAGTMDGRLTSSLIGGLGNWIFLKSKHTNFGDDRDSRVPSFRTDR